MLLKISEVTLPSEILRVGHIVRTQQSSKKRREYHIRFILTMGFFCNFTSCNEEPEQEIIDWNSSSENIVQGTLRREHLLVKLQELEDSQSSDGADAALRAMDEAVSEDDALYLKWMERAGTLSIIQEVLQREQEQRPSPLVVAPLLHKFAKHQIGCTPRPPASITARSRLVKYLRRAT